MRLPDYMPRLQAVIDDWSHADFAYGSRDCAMFGAACVEAMTGIDLREGIGNYKTELGGLRQVKKLGYEDHVDVFASEFPPADRLKFGDLAVVEQVVQQRKLRAIGLMHVRSIYVMTQTRGLAMVPKSWSVAGFSV